MNKQIETLMALADAYASSKDSPTYGIENRVALKSALEAALKPGEPVAEVVTAVKPPNASPAWLPFKTVYASIEWLDSVQVGTKLYTAAPPAQTPPPRLTDDTVTIAYQMVRDHAD